jgi:uncharacterized membrane protein YedE/YeeE
MENFTPISALIGGGLIGLSAALLLLFKGRVAGISGIVGGVLVPEKGDVDWRIVFVVGLILGGFLYQWLGGDVSEIKAVVSQPMLIAAGLLVGIGTTVGTGCTSGHGICGIARFSGRSMTATVSFMVTGIITVALVRHVFGG